jgi:hypothetical protein
VDVIWHHHKRDKVIQRSDLFAELNRFRNGFGDLRLPEPSGTERYVVEVAVGRSESVPVAAAGQRDGAAESKRHEQGLSVGLNVRKIAAIFHTTLVV